ncbi:chorismate mutase [Lacrimispora sp.]|uniref:chorismate mutase n=1 Tax=Lacrimispora sp. TaxID=2719234 RepID=UPI0028A6D69C|nr:chorismate mutase [Lacrimispora sp.]
MACKSLEEVRNNIDRIDKEIIMLIAERGNFVKHASKFKKDSQDVTAPQRVEAVIQKVRQLSEEYGANPDMVEKLYRDMIANFVRIEMNEFNNNNRFV